MSRPIVKLQDVWYKEIIRGVNLEIGRGVTVILGSNGAGKTTLLRLIAGAEKPSRGYIEAPERVGAVWENPYFTFYKGTVLEEIEDAAGSTERALELLEKFGLKHLAERPALTLSLGQARLVALLAAVSWEPDIVVLDEPTSGLDPREIIDQFNLIKSLEIPVIMSTHEIEVAATVGDIVVVLEDGKVAGKGSPEELPELGYNPLVLKVSKELGVDREHAFKCLFKT
ncbi:MAG: energy-coupling factor ABC transporter ATP-binding protein [Desulfurococcales archaeon]|nr:energy-coupling factor ABC transporter ATP-binding protein [Desulfurococcales archaeon]